MKYIILDLEWNSAYSVKESRFINEIIEIGAVKLDENLNEIGDDESYLDYLNPESLKVLKGCKLENNMTDVENGTKFQFVRNGYFCKDTRNENVYNRIVSLKDSFKI